MAANPILLCTEDKATVFTVDGKRVILAKGCSDTSSFFDAFTLKTDTKSVVETSIVYPYAEGSDSGGVFVDKHGEIDYTVEHKVLETRRKK